MAQVDTLSVASLMQALDKIQVRSKVQGDCVVWLGAKTTYGHGTLRITGVTQYVHRLIYESMLGCIPKGKVIRHLCHNPSCIKPAHLALGTKRENSQDSARVGRMGRPSRLTKEETLEIYASHDKQADIAYKYGITQSLVSKIQSGRSGKRAWF